MIISKYTLEFHHKYCMSYIINEAIPLFAYQYRITSLKFTTLKV